MSNIYFIWATKRGLKAPLSSVALCAYSQLNDIAGIICISEPPKFSRALRVEKGKPFTAWVMEL